MILILRANEYNFEAKSLQHVRNLEAVYSSNVVAVQQPRGYILIKNRFGVCDGAVIPVEELVMLLGKDAAYD